MPSSMKNDFFRFTAMFMQYSGYGLWGEKTGLPHGLRQPCFLFVTVSLETTYMARILSMALDVRSSSVGSGGIISAVMVLS